MLGYATKGLADDDQGGTGHHVIRLQRSEVNLQVPLPNERGQAVGS